MEVMRLKEARDTSGKGLAQENCFEEAIKQLDKIQTHVQRAADALRWRIGTNNEHYEEADTLHQLLRKIKAGIADLWETANEPNDALERCFDQGLLFFQKPWPSDLCIDDLLCDDENELMRT